MVNPQEAGIAMPEQKDKTGISVLGILIVLYTWSSDALLCGKDKSPGLGALHPWAFTLSK